MGALRAREHVTPRTMARRPSLPSSAALNQRIQGARGPDELLELFREHRDSMDHVHLGSLWHRLSRTQQGRMVSGGSEAAPTFTLPRGDAFRELVAHTGGVAESLNPQSLANSAQGAASCGMPAELLRSLLRALEPRALHLAESFETQNLCQLTVAFGKAELCSPQLFAALARVAIRTRERGGVRELVRPLGPHDVSDLAWSYGTLGTLDAELFEHIEAVARRNRLIDFSPRDLVHLAEGTVAAGLGSTAFIDSVATTAASKMEKLFPPEVARVLGAIGRSSAAPDAVNILFRAAESDAPSLHKFSADDLSRFLEGFSLISTGGGRTLALFEDAVRPAARKAAEAPPPALARLLTAYTAVGVRAPELFAAVARAARVTRTLQAFAAEDLASLLHADDTAAASRLVSSANANCAATSWRAWCSRARSEPVCVGSSSKCRSRLFPATESRGARRARPPAAGAPERAARAPRSIPPRRLRGAVAAAARVRGLAPRLVRAASRRFFF